MNMIRKISRITMRGLGLNFTKILFFGGMGCHGE
jgi:hypothetical protein